MEVVQIKDIVETYEGLSERQREKITRIAERQIEEQEITGFDSQYKYVAELAEKFQQPYAERIALRF